MANYFANSAIGPNISTIDANGPFWPYTSSSKSVDKAQQFQCQDSYKKWSNRTIVKKKKKRYNRTIEDSNY